MILDQFVSIEKLGLLADLNLGLLVMEVLLFVTSLFLMLLILVQRGKGGGLTGALGGMGGQSAFGSKAGDAFTKITIITAVVWIMLCMVTIAGFNPPPQPKITVNNDEEIGDVMGGDETDVPPVNDDDNSNSEPKGTENATGENDTPTGAAPTGDGSTPDGDSTPAAATTENAADADPDSADEDPDSSGTVNPETHPDGEGN